MNTSFKHFIYFVQVKIFPSKNMLKKQNYHPIFKFSLGISTDWKRTIGTSTRINWSFHHQFRTNDQDVTNKRTLKIFWRHPVLHFLVPKFYILFLCWGIIENKNIKNEYSSPSLNVNSYYVISYNMKLYSGKKNPITWFYLHNKITL